MRMRRTQSSWSSIVVVVLEPAQIAVVVGFVLVVVEAVPGLGPRKVRKNGKGLLLLP